VPDLGLGLAPLGSTPFGFGSPALANSTSVKLYLASDNTRRNAAQIDSVSGDILRNPANGIHTGMDAVAQQVYLALRTLKNSSIVKNLGIAFNVKTISETTARKLADEVRLALADLVNRRLVEIVKISSDRVKVTGVRVAVEWRNLTNGETNVTRWENV
jgi:hypothetical protein